MNGKTNLKSPMACNDDYIENRENITLDKVDNGKFSHSTTSGYV